MLDVSYEFFVGEASTCTHTGWLLQTVTVSTDPAGNGVLKRETPQAKVLRE